MPIIDDANAIPGRRTTIYPTPLDIGFDGRVKRAMTEALGLTQFGVNLTTLEPGAMSSHRHWHAKEDECVFVLTGELVLINNEGEHILKAGAAAGFPAGDPNGHHIVNRSDAPATYLEIGTRSPGEVATYTDVDLCGKKCDGKFRFFRKDGTPYE